MSPRTNPAPHPVDVHVGANLRRRRRALRMTQDQLARAIGLTFQQVQKYENGTNRISASKLWEIAAALEMPVDALFDGIPSQNDERGKLSSSS